MNVTCKTDKLHHLNQCDLSKKAHLAATQIQYLELVFPVNVSCDVVSTEKAHTFPWVPQMLKSLHHPLGLVLVRNWIDFLQKSPRNKKQTEAKLSLLPKGAKAERGYNVLNSSWGTVIRWTQYIRDKSRAYLRCTWETTGANCIEGGMLRQCVLLTDPLRKRQR